MRTILLINSCRIFLFFIFLVPVKSFAEDFKEAKKSQEYPFPYFMKNEAERRMIYSYSFEDVWSAVMKVIEDLDKETNKWVQENGIKAFKWNMKSDKGSGLVLHMNNHMGKRGFFKIILPCFTEHIFYIKRLESHKTRVFCHRVNYALYNGPPLYYGRYLLLIPNEADILRKIDNKLQGAHQ